MAAAVVLDTVVHTAWWIEVCSLSALRLLALARPQPKPVTKLHVKALGLCILIKVHRPLIKQALTILCSECCPV